jgi:biotin carboxylase
VKIKLLMVGRNRSFIKALEKKSSEIELYLLEEPDLHERHKKSPFFSPILKETRTGHYQQSDGLIQVLAEWHSTVGFHAIIPGVEYAVMGAGKAAKELKLPYLGDLAISSLTNKLRLREICKLNNIPHPRFSRVESIEDIKNFFNGEKVVIKPSNRQASAGVIKINMEEEVEGAYYEMLATDEGHKIVNRKMNWEFMVEEYMEGPEFSVETLVQNGKVIFHNITQKETTNEKYFVELGHLVPAPITSDQANEILNNKNKLVSALKAENGFLHSEWKYTDDGPKLVECAGRAAGDSIMELIEISYGFNIYAAIVRILANQKVNIPNRNHQGSCIQFFNPNPGVLKEIKGIEYLEHPYENLISYSLTVKSGDRISPLNSSWARVGYIITKGRDAIEAKENADYFTKFVEFVME